jgi:hypothetical protein
MNCDPIVFEHGDGTRHFLCARCGYKTKSTTRTRWVRDCPIGKQNSNNDGESIESGIESLLPAEDRVLLGGRIKQLLAAIGIPACDGCEARAAWLDRAHRWIIGE